MTRALSCLIVCLVACAMPCDAHVDTIIQLRGKTLVGLPSQYSPAELDLEAFRLRVGRHVMQFSPLIREFFERQPYDLQVLASWYHDDSSSHLPPYLVLAITPKGRDYTYHVALALDTLRLLDVSVRLRSSKVPPDKFTEETLQIALTDLQKKEIEQSVKDVR
jgi:hypothetical protein